MSLIAFDLEWNQPQYNEAVLIKKTKMHLCGEIIQIGAIKLNDKLEPIDSFSIIVKPKFIKKMHKKVSEITKITDEALKLGLPFVEALQHFKKWCGDKPILLSWGIDDLIVLVENMQIHNLENDFSYEWYDGQAIYTYEKHGQATTYSLKKALDELEISLDLELHNALNDSKYLASVLASINLKEGLINYDNYNRDKKEYIIYPKPLQADIYENLLNKNIQNYNKKIKSALCPICGCKLAMNTMKKINSDKYLAIGNCISHGKFGVAWMLYRYKVKNNGTRYLCFKSVFRINSKIELFYNNKKD